MSYNVLAISPFDRQLKLLAKKYPSLKKEYAALLESLAEQPEQGISLGNHCYKIRIAIASKSKGKSGGARVVTHVVIMDNTVFLIAIYDKAEKENLTDKELNDLLKYIPD